MSDYDEDLELLMQNLFEGMDTLATKHKLDSTAILAITRENFGAAAENAYEDWIEESWETV
jgi:hypothetical protein